MAKFKPWDIIRRIHNTAELNVWTVWTVEDVNDKGFLTLVSKSNQPFYFDPSRFELAVEASEPINIINNELFMQHYHTAVLIKKAPTTTQIDYEELIPYKVMTASDEQNMRDILVRELPKEVDSKDCLFKISKVFN